MHRNTRQIKVGDVKIGGGAPVSIQSMAKTDTRDIYRTIKEIKVLEAQGCEIVRVAVKDRDSAEAISKIKRKIRIPLVADIHFNYSLALLAIENGADKIRLNPGNIYKENEIREVVRSAKNSRIPIRVGVNSGSLVSVKRKVSSFKKDNLADLMVKKALDYIKLLGEMDFYDIIVSLKTSDILSTIDAYKKISEKTDYPLHLGITAAGPIESGLVKSSIGIGVLLLEGIGDTIRVSLTGDSCDEVKAAKNILSALRLRNFGPEIISCPTCGRCQVDLRKIVREIEERLAVSGLRCAVGGSRQGKARIPRIAIMGCEVNGPGEAKEADIGVACGKGYGAIFENGKIIKRVKQGEIIKELLKLIAHS